MGTLFFFFFVDSSWTALATVLLHVRVLRQNHPAGSNTVLSLNVTIALKFVAWIVEGFQAVATLCFVFFSGVDGVFRRSCSGWWILFRVPPLRASSSRCSTASLVTQCFPLSWSLPCVFLQLRLRRLHLVVRMVFAWVTVMGSGFWLSDRKLHEVDRHLSLALWARWAMVITAQNSSRRSDSRCSLGSQFASAQQTCLHESCGPSRSMPRVFAWRG